MSTGTQKPTITEPMVYSPRTHPFPGVSIYLNGPEIHVFLDLQELDKLPLDELYQNCQQLASHTRELHMQALSVWGICREFTHKIERPEPAPAPTPQT